MITDILQNVFFCVQQMMSEISKWQIFSFLGELSL